MMPCIAGYMSFSRKPANLVVYVAELQNMLDEALIPGIIVGFDGASNSILVKEFAEEDPDEPSSGSKRPYQYIEYKLNMSVDGNPEVRQLDAAEALMHWDGLYDPASIAEIEKRFAKFLKKRVPVSVHTVLSLGKVQMIHYVLCEDMTAAGVHVYRVLRIGESDDAMKQVPEAYHKTWGVTTYGTSGGKKK